MPTCSHQIVNMLEDGAHNFTATDIQTFGSDVEDASVFKFVLVAGPSHGSGDPSTSFVVDANSHLSYSPAANYFGSDEITFLVEDSDGAQSTNCTITFNIQSVCGLTSRGVMAD